MKVKILAFTALLAFVVLAGFANSHCLECYPNNPPSIAGLPDQTVMVGQTIPFLDLFTYASDTEDYDYDLVFSIDYQSNPSVISCYITGNRYVGCGAAQSAGFSDITVRVTDTGGLYDTDTFRITVQSQPPSQNSPVINSLVITPSSPKDSDNLACTAQASDQDGNLERVQFTWFVNGGLEKTRTIYVAGSSGTVQDTIDSTRSGIGDEVKCEATIYDTTGNQDSDFDTVTIEGASCSVDVYSLEVVSNNQIRFWIRNKGQSTQEIGYQIYVDGMIKEENSVTLDPNEIQIVQKSYSFGFGDFVIKAKAISQCGASDSETIIHTVLEPDGDGNDNPVIDSVRISPSNPDEEDDLTCRVEVSDDNGDLEKVQFKWYVEGDLEKTRTVSVSGSSDEAEDSLGSGYSDSGDEVRCLVKAYDEEGNTDSDSDVVTIEGENGDCGVDVYNLEFIDNNEIRFRIRNTGRDTENINYKVYVEGENIIEHNILLDEDEWESIEETFSFDISDSIVKVKVKAECGSTDSEVLETGDHGRCTARYLDEYRCSGNWAQRKYQNSDCTYIWVNSEYCSSGCSNGFCIGTGGQCGVSIQKFDYQTNVVAGNAAYVTLEARNTGTHQEIITLSLLVNGQLKESYPATINAGSVSLRTFYYYPAAGTHQILAKAETNCGSADTRTATVTVSQSGMPSPYPYPTPQPQPAPSLPTSVSIYPSSLDTCLCDAKFITINIHNSVEQVFTIQVSGVPGEWVSYQSQNIVEQGDRQLFVYAGPKELGTHTIKIRVTAGTERKDYEQDVSIYTAPCPEKPPQDGGITGSLIEAAKSPLFWIVLIILVGAVVIFIGAARLRPDEEFYEPVYPYRTYRPVRRSQT